VTPGEQHLIALRKSIYQTIKPHPKPSAPERFKEVVQQEVSFPLHVPAGDLTASLLEMTPFSWKLTPELQEQLIKDGLVDCADFQIGIYEKMI
jgi:23S rRNA (guanine745-N1)-methyltransferase